MACFFILTWARECTVTNRKAPFEEFIRSHRFDLANIRGKKSKHGVYNLILTKN